MRLGIFGGTFDPPHVGHFIVAQDAIEALHLDRVLLIPAGVPPHKAGMSISPAATRLEMLRLAVGTDDRFTIETLELDRPGPSYSVDTVEALRAKYPDDELVLLIGADQYREMATWHQPERLASLVMIGVMTRKGAGGSAVPGGGGGPGGHSSATEVAVTRIDISSTSIRQRVRAGRRVTWLVAPNVEEYIVNNRLYRE